MKKLKYLARFTRRELADSWKSFRHPSAYGWFADSSVWAGMVTGVLGGLYMFLMFTLLGSLFRGLVMFLFFSIPVTGFFAVAELILCIILAKDDFKRYARISRRVVEGSR